MEHLDVNTTGTQNAGGNHNDSASHAPEYIQTPRGRFRIIAADKGDDPDLSEWFEHEEWILVTDGNCAYAIAKTDWRRPLLNPDLVRRANSSSQFDAGTSIERDARHALGRFEREFPEDGQDSNNRKISEGMIAHYFRYGEDAALRSIGEKVAGHYPNLAVIGEAMYRARIELHESQRTGP